MVDDFDNDSLALKTELLALPDSFVAGYLFQPQKYGLTLRIDAEKPILAGVLGKEKPLDVVLTPKQTALLLGLAAHSRGFAFATVVENISFHSFGWVDVKNNPALQAELIQLVALFKDTGLIIENYRDILFRLSLNPEVIYFDEALFTYLVHTSGLSGTKTKIPVIIERQAFLTALGMAQDKKETFQVTLDFAHKLQELSKHQFSTDNEKAVKIEDTYKKGLHSEPKFLALGLRRLIRRDAGVIRFCCKLVELPVY